MTVLAVIPARGGSKGVWRKNLRRVAGEPLIAHAVRAVIGSRHCSHIAISSDDREIGAEAFLVWSRTASNSAKLFSNVRRPAELAVDEASSESAVIHAIKEATCEGIADEHITLLVQCTSPLTIPEDVDGVIEMLRATPDADCCFTVTRFHGFVWKPPAFVRDLHFDGTHAPSPADARALLAAIDSGMAKDIAAGAGLPPLREEPPCEVLYASTYLPRKPRQTLLPYWLETGAIYAMRTEAFLRTGSRFCGKPVLYEVPADRAVDIDSELDIEIADFLLTKRKARCGL